MLTCLPQSEEDEHVAPRCGDRTANFMPTMRASQTVADGTAVQRSVLSSTSGAFSARSAFEHLRCGPYFCADFIMLQATLGSGIKRYGLSITSGMLRRTSYIWSRSPSAIQTELLGAKQHIIALVRL